MGAAVDSNAANPSLPNKRCRIPFQPVRRWPGVEIPSRVPRFLFG